MNTEQLTDQEFMVTTEAGQRAWRMGLQVGDEVALECIENGGSVSYCIHSVVSSTGHINAEHDEYTDAAQIILPSWEAFSRETGRYLDGDGSCRVVYPTAAIREQISLSEELQGNFDFRSEPLSKLRAAAWALGILDAPAPGFEDDEDFDREERAGTLEELMAATDLHQIKVHSWNGCLKKGRKHYGDVVDPKGPKEIFGLSLRSLIDVPTGNYPGSEELAHLIAFALRSVPDYCRLVREERRNNERVDRLLSAFQRRNGHLPDEQLAEGAAADITEVVSYGDDVDATRRLSNGEPAGWSELWDQLPDIIGVLCNRLGGRAVVTDAQRQEDLNNSGVTIARYSDRIVIELKGGK